MVMKPLRFFWYFLWSGDKVMFSANTCTVSSVFFFFTAFQAHSSSVKRICQAGWYQVWDQKG